MSALDPEEAERYRRHILLKEIGGAGQQRLKSATVAIVGMGGLGAPAALYLAAAGVGVLRLIDDDEVQVSNLQRQVIYRTSDIGKLKATAARDSLASLNPHSRFDIRPVRLTESNCTSLLTGADAVLDGSDNFETRFSVNRHCRALAIPLVSGAVGRWDGQVGVFTSGLDARAPCYRCFVPEAPPDAEPCSAQGIVGALTGVIGAMMALETIKLLARSGESLAGRLFIYDALLAETRTAHLHRDPHCPECGEAGGLVGVDSE